jgi:hypothetical protein
MNEDTLSKSDQLLRHILNSKHGKEEFQIMSCILKKSLLKLGVTLMLSGVMIVGTLALRSPAVFAAACAPGTEETITSPAISASCDTSISANLGQGLLEFHSDTAATVGSVTAGAASTTDYHFASLVTDLRNVGTGWSLQAASAGLANGSTSVPLVIGTTGDAASCTPSDGQATCVTPAFATAFQLSTTATTFVSATSITGTPIISGTFPITTHGTFSFTGGEPSGAYSGTITLTLQNASGV